jgi:hypothetical protein
MPFSFYLLHQKVTANLMNFSFEHPLDVYVLCSYFLVVMKATLALHKLILLFFIFLIFWPERLEDVILKEILLLCILLFFIHWKKGELKNDVILIVRCFLI